MKQKKKQPNEFTAAEIQLIEHLREHPEMRVQVQSILDIVRHAAGPMKTADEVEELLVAAMRRLGNVTLGQWASQAEERVSHELQRQDPTVRSRKKNADVVVCFWIGDGPRADLAQPDPELCAPVAPALGGDAPGPVAPIGTGADGLWERVGLCPGGGKCAGALWI